ncbi:MAG TPA: hypothetical protein PLD20_24175 [Blastocatellia bacterium]|nr:hypothetical protein [Blastocatellia bacterium]HMX25513.1 hypothetical protein [Blastocatellia bacterium]HMZ21052.1 hypothetical protein [Blastocatellia bacterium]HNG31484.1 hypothetical protein [Blastocatellia bacterium]
MSRKITEITIETEQVVLVRTQTGVRKCLCHNCSAIVRMATPEHASLLTRISAREIYRRAENGELHFTETPEGMLLICLASLTDVTRREITQEA